MTVITMTAVGFREVQPLSELGRDFTMVLLAAGITGIGVWFRADHLIQGGLLVAVSYAAFTKIVGRQLHFHPISLKHPNVVLPHLTGEIRQDLVPVL